MMKSYDAMSVRGLDGQTRYYLDGVRVRASRFKEIQQTVELAGRMSSFRTAIVSGAVRQYAVWEVAA